MEVEVCLEVEALPGASSPHPVAPAACKAGPSQVPTLWRGLVCAGTKHKDPSSVFEFPIRAWETRRTHASGQGSASPCSEVHVLSRRGQTVAAS